MIERNVWTWLGRFEIALNDRLPSAEGPRIQFFTSYSVEFCVENGGGFYIRWWGRRATRLCLYNPLAHDLAFLFGQHQCGESLLSAKSGEDLARVQKMR